MNIYIELDNPKQCDGCPLLDTSPLWEGKPIAPPECKMGYKPRWKKASSTEALIPTQIYTVTRSPGCIEVNGE